MKPIQLHKHAIFRETENVLFYDITIPESNATDLVIHDSTAVSPPDDKFGNKQFYIHHHQIDHNRVVYGSRTFELINLEWEKPYQIVKLNRNSGALKIPKGTFHRSVSSQDGSIVINQSERDELFKTKKEFCPISVVDNKELERVIKYIRPVIIKC